MAEESKLQIDDDWKSQAQKEKERLAEELEAAPEQSGGMGAFPKADFKEIISMLVTQAVIGLNGMRDPSGRNIPPTPEVAKLYIDLLEVLEQKTRGNLAEDEQRLLDTALYQLRMAYVQLMAGPATKPRPGGPAGS